MTTDILDKFTAHLKNTLAKAYSLATEFGAGSIEPEHLLLALVLEHGSVGGEILRKCGLSAEELRQALRFTSKPNDATGSPKLTDESKRVIEKSALVANIYNHPYIGSEHLLLALIEIENPGLTMLISAQNIMISDLKRAAETILKSTAKLPEIAQAFEGHREEKTKTTTKEPAKSGHVTVKKATTRVGKTPALEFFAVDVTNLARDGKVDPVIGRDKEIERVIQILSRRTKNNPALLGEPGVGKTAIVEGLATKIINGDVPESLRDRRLLSLDLGLMLAGTIYRGEFEGRVKQIIDEVKNNPDVILFIDELHTIMGAGATNGSIDAANILKPALARGELRTIGATTLAEYKKHIENDSALERRFQIVMIDPPSVPATVDILKGLRPKYESYHQVIISDEAIEAAVKMSDRFIADRFLPDKAIDLIDEACAMTKIKHGAIKAPVTTASLAEDLERVRAEKQTAVNSEQFVKALELKTKEQQLLQNLETAPTSTTITTQPTITKREIAIVIGKSTGIPVADLVMEERQRLLKIEEALSERIIGQDEAVKTVAEFVRRAKIGIANPSRPLASFLFLGPSGVGKTELAKTLAATVFQDPDALVRIDMSEFSEPFSVSKLVGAPAGYVGYKDSSKLTDTIKRKPYSLVLFDEIEKAHGDLHNLLLQILDDGRITDAAGRTINFKNTIIIMTSNVGANVLQEKTLGFGAHSANAVAPANLVALHEDIMAELERSFRPEFINRIDKILTFNPLNLENLAQIAKLQLTDLARRVAADYQATLTVKPNVYALIAERSFNPIYGARTVRRNIQEIIENQLAKELILNTSKNFVVEAKAGLITVTAKRTKVKMVA